MDTQKQFTNDYEDEQDSCIFEFDKPEVRMPFIRKVYAILSVQLIFSAGLVALSVFNNDYRDFVMAYPVVLFTAIILSIILMYALVCYKVCARKVPLNFILLSLFTVCEAYMISAITMAADPQMVLIAAILTAGIVVSLTIYAITTKTDFTMMGGILFMVGMTLLLASLLSIFFRNRLMEIVISACSVVLFGLYLIYDTQLIIGGKAMELSVDDYIIGALMLYLDIVQIFLEILAILGDN